jgi:hypothetical protein
MSQRFYKGRRIDFTISHGKDPVDSFLEEAWYIDDGDGEISDEDLEKIQEKYADVIQADWFEAQIDKAERLYDESRGH